MAARGTTSRRTALAVLLVVLGLLALPARAIPPTGWIPNTLLVPPFVGESNNRPSFLHLTRRVVPQPNVPGRVLLGHTLYGLWESVPGFGWTPLTPACFTLAGPLLLQGVVPAPGCGVEGIAIVDNGAVNDRLALYVSTYNLDLLSPGAPIEPGGVWKAELARLGPQSVSSAGLTWRQVLPGVRGNAMIAKRDSSGQTTLVAGRIQRNGSDVGTDTNAWCAPGCQPSVYVSHDGGNTWSAKTFTGSSCSPAVGTSSRLVGNIAWDRNAPNVIYAAANSGLWISTTNGDSWAYTFFSCGNAPGFALTERSTPGRIYIGRNTDSLTTSELWTATRDAGGAYPFSALIDAVTFQPVRFQGWVQSIQIDRRDASERTLFVASWRYTGSTGIGTVYKVVDRGNGTATVTQLGSSLLGQAPNVGPYPITFAQYAPSLFLAQHPLVPDLIYASTVLGGVWTRSDGTQVL